MGNRLTTQTTQTQWEVNPQASTYTRSQAQRRQEAQRPQGRRRWRRSSATSAIDPPRQEPSSGCMGQPRAPLAGMAAHGDGYIMVASDGADRAFLTTLPISLRGKAFR